MNTLALTLLFTTATATFKLPPNLLSSLCYVESKHDVAAIHHDDGGSDSIGVCQIKLKTAHWLGFQGTAQQLRTPKTNIWYAAKYLSYQLKRYQGSIPKAVISYNKGHAGLLTRTDYSEKVIKQWKIARGFKQ